LKSSEILRSLVEGAPAILRKGGKLVVMHPKSLEVGPIAEVAGGELRVEQELEIYIHRTLTRTITLMRRGPAR
jgi:tRNA G10  N-methylase Trm11